MDPIVQPEPQSAAAYADRSTRAVKAVLIEIGQILGSFRDKFAIIGGAVPWLLLDNDEMPHVGTLDIDVGLDAEALADGEYARLIEVLMGNGYEQRRDLRRFQLVRRVPAPDGGRPIEVVVDFLRPLGAEIARNVPPLIDQFATIRASGADLALRFSTFVTLEGPMPEGGRNRVRMAVASIPALLAMKGLAIGNRHKQKDCYDIYYCVRNYPGGIEVLATACRPLLAFEEARQGFCSIAEKFNGFDGYGPTCVRRFVEDTRVLGERSPEQWQMDAFGQVDAWLEALFESEMA